MLDFVIAWLILSHEAHPAYWAPFVVVGEGSAPAIGSAARTPAKKSAPKSWGGGPGDWTVEILRQ